MAALVKRAMLITIILTAVFALLYIRFNVGILLTLSITCGTTAYHFCMRFAVGNLFDKFYYNKADYRNRWFTVSEWEQKLYKKLGVKKWKNKMPSYKPEYFDIKKHTWDEILKAMCQAEIGHETTAVLSFLPLFAVRWFDAFPAFFITSLLAAVFDLMLVMMQRFNRSRIIKMLDKKTKRA